MHALQQYLWIYYVREITVLINISIRCFQNKIEKFTFTVASVDG